MKVLHLFDLYLPQTMNWVLRQMHATPSVEHWVAAPWILDNEYHQPNFRYFVHPIQQKSRWMPAQESTMAWFSTNLIRFEKVWPLYRTWLYHQLKDDPPDLLHAHFGPVGCHFMGMANRLKIPIITSFYGFDFARLPFQKPAYLQKYRSLFNQAAAITTTGELTPALLTKLGCPREKITPIPLSILPNEFPFQKRRKKAGQLRLVQVATFTDKKGHLDTLEAFKIARVNCPGLQLTLAGEAQDKTLLKVIHKYIEANALKEVVQVLDFVPHAKLPKFLEAFDVFVHPSRTAANQDCEGAPVVILEAMSVGLPVIATWHSDIPKQVLHGKTGYLSPERDPADLATHIEQLHWMEENAYQSMSFAAHQHVLQHFNLHQNGPKLLQRYQSIL